MIPTHPTTATAQQGGTALRFEGRDVLGVLHRISTAGLEDLEPGEARATLFCDFRARLLHRAAVAHARDGGIWLVRADAPPAELLAHIERHVFRDDVQVTESSPAPIAVSYGTPLTRGAIEQRAAGPTRISLVSGETFEWPGEGRASDDVARIRAGLPRHGFEIRDAFHPFEVGLATEVHLSKGCYTGQEVLQRLITYDSVRRRLVLVTGEGAPPPPGARLIAAGEPAGNITSAAADGGGYVALAVMKRDALARPAVEVEGTTSPARVETFPEVHPQGLP